MKENKISYKSIGAAFKVHTALGPGMLESTYKRCLLYELQTSGLQVEAEVEIPIRYNNLEIPKAFKADIIVENSIVIELKAVDELNDVHFAQLLTYLKFGGYKVGLLINFNTTNLKKGIRRVINT